MLPFIFEEQLSDTVGILKLTIPGHDITESIGQLAITGGTLSLIDTENEHSEVLSDPSVATNVFIVTPFGKKEPVGKPTVCSILTIMQSSDAVGVVYSTTPGHDKT